MKRKFTARIIAVLSAMTMAVTMMVTSASANTWSVTAYKNGSSSYNTTNATYSGYLVTTNTSAAGVSKCRVNCTSFSENASATVTKPYVHYWTFVSGKKDGSEITGSGFGRQTFSDVHSSYITLDLSTPVHYGEYLQFRVEIIDYTHANGSSMSGNYIW